MITLPVWRLVLWGCCFVGLFAAEAYLLVANRRLKAVNEDLLVAHRLLMKSNRQLLEALHDRDQVVVISPYGPN